jgi:hypothetical protein
MQIKHILQLIAILIIFSDLNSQTLEQVDKKLDSLTAVKKEKQKKIDALEESLNKTLQQIEKYELLKKKLLPVKNVTEKRIIARVIHEGGILRDAPVMGANNIADINEKEIFYVLEYSGNLFFKVQYKQKTGYLIYSSIAPNNDVDKILLEENQKSNSSITQQVDLNDPKYLRLVKIYNKEIAIRLMNKDIWAGMSQGMILESIGKPQNKTNNTTESEKSEQWEYADKVLYIENGELKKWINK